MSVPIPPYPSNRHGSGNSPKQNLCSNTRKGQRECGVLIGVRRTADWVGNVRLFHFEVVLLDAFEEKQRAQLLQMVQEVLGMWSRSFSKAKKCKMQSPALFSPALFRDPPASELYHFYLLHPFARSGLNCSRLWTSYVFYPHVCSQRVQIHIMWPWYIILRYLRSYCPLTQSVWGIVARGDIVLEELPRLCIWCPLLRKVGCHHTRTHHGYMCVPHIFLTNYNIFVVFTKMLLH